MSDGSTKLQTIDEKFDVKIKFQHITNQFRSDLKDVHLERSSFYYVAFGTTTNWDQVFFRCVWDGPFNFNEYADDATDGGFKGEIRLKETTYF